MPANFPTTGLTPGVTTYTYSGRTWLWTGTAWKSQGTIQGIIGATGAQGIQGPGTFYTYSTTPPASPAVGDRWVNSNDGVSYTYTYDGDSSAWVELNAIGYAGLQGIPGPQGIIGTGTQGLQGSLGIQGVNGIQGPIGSAIYDLDQSVISMQVFR